nr:metallophosphoesterase [uncultured Flavobacterium sp.]
MFLFYFALFIIIADLYAYQIIKRITKSKFLKTVYILITLSILAYLGYVFYGFDRKTGQNDRTLLATGVLLTLYIPRFWIAICLFVEDIFRIIFGIFNINKQSKYKNKFSDFLPNRTKFFAVFGVIIAGIHFFAFLHGIFIGRYNYRVIEQNVASANVPASFNEFKILQLSDMHLGSLARPDKIKEAVNLINQQEYDILVFTGDLVNARAVEVDKWKDIIANIKTPKYGKYAVLGNHDYGDYVKFDTEADKKQNFNQILKSYSDLGFTLLNNQNVAITNQKDTISLIGVENWGRKFIQKGDLKLASKNVNPNHFKILLSHDPSHFELEVINNKTFYDLTLSGHTHGFQFGIEIPGYLQWSPVKWVYKHWAGLYNENGRYLYVNRGFGYHGYPGRVGVRPEITILTLQYDQNKKYN